MKYLRSLPHQFKQQMKSKKDFTKGWRTSVCCLHLKLGLQITTETLIGLWRGLIWLHLSSLWSGLVLEILRGERSFDISSEMEKFSLNAKQKASTEFSKETESYSASRISAIQVIQIITNWILLANFRHEFHSTSYHITKRQKPR